MCRTAKRKMSRCLKLTLDDDGEQMNTGLLGVPGVALLCLVASLCIGCATTATQRLDTSPPTQIKNVILVIGDGMGPQQLGLLEEYARRAPNSIYQGAPTTLSQLIAEGSLGLSRSGPADALVVDSACSATQLADRSAPPS